MTPEAFLEICEQQAGSSNPGFVETVRLLVDDTLNDESFEMYFEKLKREFGLAGKPSPTQRRRSTV